MNQAEQGAGATVPWQRGKLIHGGDHESGQPSIDRLVDPDNGEVGLGAVEGAPFVDAMDPEIRGLNFVGDEPEGPIAELRPAPGAILQGNRSGLAIVRVKFAELLIGAI